MLRGPCQRLLASSIGYNGHLHASQAHWLTSLSQQPQQRQFSTGTDFEHEIATINEKFAEAREEIEFAREDAETVYFNESVQQAREVVHNCLGLWKSLLNKAPADEQAKLQRSMGLKMEQLKAELKELEELHA